MKERKRKTAAGGIAQAVLALAVLYAAAALIPAGVYGAFRSQREQSSSHPVSSVPEESASSAGESASAESSQAPSAASQIPGFLDGPSPGEPETFSLYDEAQDKTLTLTARELIPGAVACEMDLSSPEEALKAQAVACYTLFRRQRDAGEAIRCDSSEWRTWTTEEARRERWGEDYDANQALLERIAESVEGEMLTQDGEPILAAYFAISSGATETAGNVWEGDLPYLRAVASPGDMLADGYLSTEVFSEEEFQNAAASLFDGEEPDFSGTAEDWIRDIRRTPSGYTASAAVGGREFDGTDLRTAFSLRSSCFTVDYENSAFTFTVRGWGHGVGMSQAGAAFLAKRGQDHRAILSWYYPGAELTEGKTS